MVGGLLVSRSAIAVTSSVPNSRRASRECFLLLLALTQLFGRSTSFLVRNKYSRERAISGVVALQMASKTGAKRIKSYDEFQERVLSSEATRPVMVFFTAPWCGPCSLSIPVVKDCVKQYSEKIIAYEICTDDTPDIAESSGVVSIPTIQMYCKGTLTETIVGAVAKTVLSNAIDDMLEDTAKLFSAADPERQ